MRKHIPSALLVVLAFIAGGTNLTLAQDPVASDPFGALVPGEPITVAIGSWEAEKPDVLDRFDALEGRIHVLEEKVKALEGRARKGTPSPTPPTTSQAPPQPPRPQAVAHELEAGEAADIHFGEVARIYADPGCFIQHRGRKYGVGLDYHDTITNTIYRNWYRLPTSRRIAIGEIGYFDLTYNDPDPGPGDAVELTYTVECSGWQVHRSGIVNFTD